MTIRLWGPRAGAACAAVAALVTTWAVPAGAHESSAFTVSCTTVTATVADTGTPDVNDHPMVWNVRVGGGDFQVVPSTETNVGAPGEDVVNVSGDISSLTQNLAGATATVEAFVSWANGTLPAMTGTVTCGTPPTTIVEGSQVSPEVVTRPTAPAVSPAVAAAPSAVAVAPRLTG